MELSRDAVVADRYQVHSLLGRGGMAAVYLAHDRLLAREVALKLLNPALASDPTFVERFRREAQAAAGLSHPNIVAVYDWGEHGSTYFMVMEYVAGSTLKEVVRRRGPRPEREALAIGASIAAALDAAHARGVVHRDVKPHNVLLDPNGSVKVTDFGIARAAGASQITDTDQVMGSASYASPEQIQRMLVDARSDLYSLGAVLYELLTGRPPFVGDSAVSVAWQHVHTEPEPVSALAPGISGETDTFMRRAMAKRPEDRYQSATEMREALLDVLQPSAESAGSAAASEIFRPTFNDAPTVAVAPVVATRAAGALRQAVTPEFGGDRVAARLPDAAPTTTLITVPPAAGRRNPSAAPAPVAATRSRRASAGRAMLAALVAGTALLGTCALALVMQRERTGQLVAASGDSGSAEVRGVAVTPEVPSASAQPASAVSPTSTVVAGTAANVVPTVAPTVAPTAAPPTATTAPAPAAAPPTVAAPPTTVPPTAVPTQPAAPVTAAPAAALAASPTDAVLGFYSAAAQHDFARAAAYWSPRMQAQYPPAENIAGRFAQTQRLWVNSAQVVAAGGDRATIAIDLTESIGNPVVTQRWVGTWELVRGQSGWLLDSPNLRQG